MIEDKTVLAIVPARGGSKRIPGKNLREVGGKPLLAWTIEEAQKSRYIDRLILSSEDDEITRIAQAWGCEVPFKRPIELAQDETPGVDPVLHALAVLPGYDYVVLLQPTSPLRRASDVDLCLEKCLTSKAAACVSVSEAEDSPYWMYTISSEGNLSKLIETSDSFTRKQDLPKVYKLNGAVYVAQCHWLSKKKSFLSDQTIAHVMPQERSIDIDTELDLQLVSLLMAY
jgi:N-acylneuraminate cytidylyltransferase